MAASYELDDIVYDFLINNTNKEKLKLYLGVINNINLLNELPNLDATTDLNDLENIFINIIQEDMDTNAKVTLIANAIKSLAINYIEAIGITLTDEREDIYFYHLVNILYGLYNIFNTNVTGAEFIIDVLRDDNNDHEVNVAELLAEYTSINKMEYIELIDDVQDNFVNYCIQYFNNIIRSYDPALDDETNNGIKRLLKVDAKFSNTDVVKDMLRLGLKPNLLANSLNNLYFNLNNYENEPSMVAYEVTATLFLCDDSEQHMEEFLTEEINLDLVDYIGNNVELKNKLLDEVRQLIRRVIAGV